MSTRVVVIFFSCVVIILLCILLTDKFMYGRSEHFLIDDNIVKNYPNYKFYNPCVYDNGTHCHLVFRGSNYCNFALDTFLSANLLKRLPVSDVFYQKMDRNFTKVFSSHIINIPKLFNKVKFIGLEDPRIIFWDNNYYIYGSYAVGPTLINVMMAKLDPSMHISETYLYKTNTVDKNWTPVIDNKSLYFIRHINPFELYEFKTPTTEPDHIIDGVKCYTCTLPMVYSHPTLSVISTKIHGGSPSVLIPSVGRLCITHIVKRTQCIYIHQFVLLEEKYPYMPIAISNDFTIDQQGMDFCVEFSSGLIVRDKTIIVTFGRFDKYVKYKTYNLDDVLHSLTYV